MTLSRTRRLPADALAGLVLLASAVLALVLANSPGAALYHDLLAVPVSFRAGSLALEKPLILWVNDGLMAVFFFLVGLEIKREMLEGELSTPARMMLPVTAAIGGMAAPAAIYALVNRADPVAIHGWAIPAATDIAFAIGAVALLGSRIVPPALKVFLTAVAVVDDLGAVVIIALFYTESLSMGMLVGAAMGVAALLALNLFGVRKLGAYVLVGIFVWVCVLKSGVHATLAGVACALCVPMRTREGDSPLEEAEHALRNWVLFGVVPIFAFANAGVALAGASMATILQPIPLGIVLGLVFGKAVGVFGAGALAVRAFGAGLPSGSTWAQFFGVCVLCGIGFTMSLFIGTLAFQNEAADYMTQVKLGVIGGSLLSTVIGVTWLLWVSRQVARELH